MFKKNFQMMNGQPDMLMTIFTKMSRFNLFSVV